MQFFVSVCMKFISCLRKELSFKNLNVVVISFKNLNVVVINGIDQNNQRYELGPSQ